MVTESRGRVSESKVFLVFVVFLNGTHVRGRQIIRKVGLVFDSVNIPLGCCSVHSGYNGLELQQVV